MKTKYFKMSVLACIITAGMISCKPSPTQQAEKVEDAQEKVDEETAKLNQSIIDSTNEYTKYKMESELKLKANEVKIADLKAKTNAQNKVTRDNYDKKLNELELKNAKLKENMENYKQGNQTDWEKFKTDFNREMDDLGKAISNINFKK